jgi:hypothetical protein
MKIYNDKMEVQVDKKFPRVLEYKLGYKRIFGAQGNRPCCPLASKIHTANESYLFRRFCF